MTKKISIAFLWHMHQPLYKDLVTGIYHLPWVRLHSTYSYLDMAAAIEDHPEARATFNITPVLMWQLLDISGDEPVKDTYLELSLKAAAELTKDERCFVLKNFFSCDLEKAIFPLKRYKELFFRRGHSVRKKNLAEKVKEFNDDDIRDLQVLFNLAWCGFTLKDKDPVVRGLLKKGRHYTEDDKRALLERQKEVVKSILPLYKKLQDEGRIEISTTPFYHPIMPLLCRGESGQGYDFKEDARLHVKRTVDLYEKVFGRKPAGMWPSEGSVSQEMIPTLVDEGIGWMATDEGILLESFRGQGITRGNLIYKPFTAVEDGKEIDVVFRDINISNAISFRYANMPPRKACSDMFKDIEGIRRAMSHREGDHLISIILDGENPWPYFPDGGKGFLAETYHHLSTSKGTQLVTIGGYLKEHGEKKKIKKLFSGSWINRNFNKWIGSPQKNKAWKYLEKARKDLLASGKAGKEAMEELYIAEGSDWFWWYDDFGCELNFVFDELYRMHLASIYRLIGKEVPYYLTAPIHAGPAAQKLAGAATPLTMGQYPRVLFLSSEVIPFAKTGGLADVAGSLPRALASLGCDVRVMMPMYKCVTDAGFELTREAGRIHYPFHESLFGFSLFSNRSGGVTTYFIREKKCFAREGLYGKARGDYHDNGVRFGFFAAAALEAAKAINFKPDIIHCNDWQTALVPFYLKFRFKDDEFFRGIKTLYTIHNMAYQGIFNKNIMKKIGIPDRFFNMNDLEFYGDLSFMKSGILYSDAVSTVSHRYAEEIMTPEFGCGLDGLLRAKKHMLYGIPNGADYSIWNPATDRFIKENYDADSIEKKEECKKDLLRYTRLAVRPDAPLIGCVTRLAEQKGMDLLAGIMDRVVKLGAGVVILGSGDQRYNEMFQDLVRKYPGSLYLCNDFNDPLAHKIEAGCDMFVMSSRYEPCGLNQMYSIKYGTVPIVRATGGLDDVIVDYDEDPENSNGFKFGPATKEALYYAITRAVRLFDNDKEWKKLMLRGMGCDFSWDRAAGQYVKLYQKIMS